jgi:L-alanine-DL-glutamate epimerase-like enolase superfamily enzyme
LRITDVRTAVIKGNFDWVLVRVSTDEGLTGLGEAYWGAGVAEIVHRLRPALVGENPFDVARLYEKLIRHTSGAGSLAGATVTAISGVELALWDLVARALGTPIHTLFGGRFRDRVRVYCDFHCGDERTPESCAARACEVVAAGYTAIKFSLDSLYPGTPGVPEALSPRAGWYEPYNRTISAGERRWMVSLVEAVRAAVGPDVLVAVDCHWKYAVDDAIRLARALEPYDLLWIEDPIPPENLDAMARVTASTRTSTCTGENLYRKYGYRELIERQAASIVAPDIPKMGGLLEAKKVADLADLYYIHVAPHNVASPIGTMAAAQVCAAMQNFLVLEFHAYSVPWWDDLAVGDGPLIQDGFIRVPDRPGHGLELDEEVARAHLRPGSSFFGEQSHE